MEALVAFLIGVTIAPLPASSDNGGASGLTPVLNDAARDRRRTNDDETVGSLPPGAMGAVRIERRIIIRLPTLRPPANAAPLPQAKVSASLARQPTTCLSLKTLKGASVDGAVGIFFITTSDSRYQATLERGCRPMDFQSGFYLGNTTDGAVCAGRDMLYARTGMQCVIASFARVLPGH